MMILQKEPSSRISSLLIILLIVNSSNVFLDHYADEFLAISAVLSVFLMYYYGRFPSGYFILFVVGFIFWTGYIVIQYDVWNYYTFIGFLTKLFLAYAVIAILREKFFSEFVNIVYKMTIAGLPLYIIGVIFPDIMYLFHKILNNLPDIFIIDHGVYLDWIRANILFYTFSIVRLGQNHGFMWEPTAFAAVLLFSIMIHLTLNKCQLDRKFIIFLLALLTTFSTTGYIAVVIIVLFILMNGKPDNKVLIGISFIVLAPFILNLDFISEKVENQFSRWDSLSNADADMSMMGNSRLSSFILDWRDFLDHPLLGLGMFEENRYLGNQFLGSVNGIGDTLSRFGLIISLLFLINFTFTFKRLANENHMRGYLLFILLFLILSWSERFMMLPLFFAFQVYYMQPRCRNQSEQSIYADH